MLLTHSEPVFGFVWFEVCIDVIVLYYGYGCRR